MLSLSEAPADPHLAARHTFADEPGGRRPAPAPRLGRTPLKTREAARPEEVLIRWGVRLSVRELADGVHVG